MSITTSALCTSSLVLTPPDRIEFEGAYETHHKSSDTGTFASFSKMLEFQLRFIKKSYLIFLTNF